jgi:hypothetical protein
MELISRVDELRNNLMTLERYIHSTDEAETEFYHNLLKNGVCFVAYIKQGQNYFGPSRFLGYKSNDMSAHISNKEKDGRQTNPAINHILGSKPEPDKDLDSDYQRFCNALGIKIHLKGAFGVERKFWRFPWAS